MALLGAILGDIIGSAYEFKNEFADDYYNHVKKPILFGEKTHFTDDSVLSLATKAAILRNPDDPDFKSAYLEYGIKYKDGGYGSMFMDWLEGEDHEPYHSFGNGAAMRVSYIADYYNKLSDLVLFAHRSAEVTHNHPEGIKGAITVATCIWMAKYDNATKDDILSFVNWRYPKCNYAFSAENTLAEMRKYYRWDETCQGSVPFAIRCLYEADSYSEFIHNVLSFKVDTDTLAAIGGGIAEELFEKDELISNGEKYLKQYLDDDLFEIYSKR